MSDRLRDKYRTVVETVAASVHSLGFKAARGRDEMFRSAGAVKQRLAVSLRLPHGESAGYVEAFPGFNFAELEGLAADLQGKKPRAGFITCSLNVGLLTPGEAAMEWRLEADSDPAAVAGLVTGVVKTFAVPFWDEFPSVASLLVRYDAGDRRVCSGSEWPWQRVAACVLLGHHERAISLLEDMLATARPKMQPTIERALRRLSSPAAR